MRLLCKVRLGSRLEPIKRRVRLGVMFFSFFEHNKKKKKIKKTMISIIVL